MKKKIDVVETYYDNRQLKSRTNYEDDKFNGLYETWYENGQLKARANYENSKPNGLHETWHENGQLKSRVLFKDGEFNGLRETWDENGQLLESVMYKDGVAVEQESDRTVSKEELLRLERENLAMKIMLLGGKQVAGGITFKESLKQAVGLIEAYDKNKIENYGFR